MTEPRVGRTAFALGFAGLLPQIAATAMVALLHGDAGSGMMLAPALFVAVAYPLLILSFLGGVWWGFAMRRPAASQGRLAGLAVLPSLAALALLSAVLLTEQIGWSLVAIGSSVMLTLVVDRHLAKRGEAPDGWMALRIPLSVTLGVLTIFAGALIGAPLSRL